MVVVVGSVRVVRFGVGGEVLLRVVGVQVATVVHKLRGVVWVDHVGVRVRWMWVVVVP